MVHNSLKLIYWRTYTILKEEHFGFYTGRSFFVFTLKKIEVFIMVTL